jgi:hypothetical protein
VNDDNSGAAGGALCPAIRLVTGDGIVWSVGIRGGIGVAAATGAGAAAAVSVVALAVWVAA